MKFIAPQLARLTEQVPTGPGWAFEVKYDGYRLQAHLGNRTVKLYTRSGLDWSDKFPTLVKELKGFAPMAVLDGELVAPGKGDRPFQRLQQALDEGASGDLVFHAFDLLQFDAHDLRPLSWEERRDALTTVMERKKRAHLRLGRRLRGSPKKLLADECGKGSEGIICKRIDAPYRSGRSDSWLKVKCGNRQEFVIVGFTEPQGSRSGIGALLLGVYDRGELRYAGKVGTGFSTGVLEKIRAKLDRIARKTSPVVHASTGLPRGAHWVSPTLVAEVSFTEWTSDGHLRHPSFQGLRKDKRAQDIIRERGSL